MSVKLFNVAPSMPSELKFLEQLSNNMWWCWHPLAIELFVRINPNLWREVEGNTRRFLGAVSQERLEELAHDPVYLRQLKAVQSEFERVVPASSDIASRSIAYFLHGVRHSRERAHFLRRAGGALGRPFESGF